MKGRRRPLCRYRPQWPWEGSTCPPPPAPGCCSCCPWRCLPACDGSVGWVGVSINQEASSSHAPSSFMGRRFVAGGKASTSPFIRSIDRSNCPQPSSCAAPLRPAKCTQGNQNRVRALFGSWPLMRNSTDAQIERAVGFIMCTAPRQIKQMEPMNRTGRSVAFGFCFFAL